MAKRPQTHRVVLPPARPPAPALHPGFTTGQVQQLTGLTSSQLISLSRTGELAADVAGARGQGHGLRFSITNVWQLAVLQRLVSGGLRMREALTIRHRLDVAFVQRDRERWLNKRVLIMDFGKDPKRVAGLPRAFWHPDSLAWLAAEQAMLAVRRGHEAKPRPEAVIVSPTLDVRSLVGAPPATLVLLIPFAPLWQALGYLTPASPNALLDESPPPRRVSAKKGRGR